MNLLKISLVLTTIAMFVFACSQNSAVNSNNSTNNVNSVNKAVVVTNTNSPPSAPTDELAAARKNYAENCVKCHKEGGIGGTSDIDGKKIKAPNFTSARMIKDADADWIESIHNGIVDEGMPAYKDKLSDQEIKDLVKLIRKDFQKQ